MPTDPWAAFPAVSSPQASADPWAAFPTVQAASAHPPTTPPEDTSLSGRWAASAPRRDAVLKSLLSTLVGTYDLGSHVIPGSNGPLSARQILQADPSNPSAPNITPTAEERPVYDAANLAQFLIPGPAGKGKAVMAADAGISALLTAMQGGNAEETAQAGLVSGVARPLLGLLGRGAVNVLGKAGDKGKAFTEFLAERMKESALHGYKEVLKPTTLENKAITQRIAPEMIDRGITALSRERMLGNATANVERFGTQIDSAIEALPQEARIRTRPLLDAMAAEKKGFQTGERTVTRQAPVGHGADGSLNLDANGAPAMRTVTETVPVYADPKPVKIIDGLAKIVADHGDEMTPDQVIKLRRIYDKQIAQAKGFAGKTLREGSEIDAKKELTSAIRAELGKQFPDLDKLNKEFSFWKNVEHVVGATVERTASQSPPLGETVMKAGVVSGALAGGSSAVAPAAVLGGLYRATNTTAWRTHSAVFKTKVADALAKGNFDEVMRLLNQIGAGATASARP